MCYFANFESENAKFVTGCGRNVENSDCFKKIIPLLTKSTHTQICLMLLSLGRSRSKISD